MNQLGQKIKKFAGILFLVDFLFISIYAAISSFDNSSLLRFLFIMVVGLGFAYVKYYVLNTVGEAVEKTEQRLIRLEECIASTVAKPEERCTEPAESVESSKRASTASAGSHQSEWIVCPSCGTKNSKYQLCCTHCGEVIIL